MNPEAAAKIEALEARIEALEKKVESEGAANGATDGLDHRDRAVLKHMRDHGRVSGYALVQLYQRRTDITNRNTAKGRAKHLEQHPEYRNV